MDQWQLVREEREDILTFLQNLTIEQWEAPSLCEGWRVRDVAVHLLVDEPVEQLGALRVLLKLIGWRLSVHKANAWWIERNRTRSMDSIIAAYRKPFQPGQVSRLLGPRNGIRALVIHHQDMRRPLGMPRTIPSERLLAVLNTILTRRGSINLDADQRARGLHLRATDLDWYRGEGPEVWGPGEALMMALAGRRVALAELNGDGKDILAGRLGTTVPRD